MLAAGGLSASKGALSMSTEKVIIDEIRDTLARDPRMPHPAEVAVSERERNVTLRGSVGSFHQRHAAVQIAKSVRGVRSVVEELRVDPRDRREDDQIRGAALQALMLNEDVSADRIDVTVADGWLTLKGEVKRQSETDAAFAEVSRLAGVV